MSKFERPSLPDEPLAALLSHGSDLVDPQLIAGRIAQGQWPVDPGYAHEGLNLIDLLASNPAITNQAEGAIELICALASTGVAITDNAWKRVDASRHGNDGGKPVKLLLRGIGEGESLATMRDACRVLNLFRPIKPVIDQANKVLDAVRAIGGWGRAVQGVSLATWFVCHDEHLMDGGYTQSAGTDDERQTWTRLRARVFGAAMKPDGDWDPNELERLLLEWRICSQDAVPGTTQAHHKDMGALLAHAAQAHPRIQALIGARLLDSMVPHLCAPKRFHWEDHKPIVEAVTGVRDNVLACMRRALCGENIERAAHKSISFYLAGNIDVVRGLPLNATCIKRVVGSLMEKDLVPARDAGKIVQEWVGKDEAMLDYARKCAKKHLDAKQNAAQDVRARLETFWLSLGSDLAPAPGARGLRL